MELSKQYIRTLPSITKFWLFSCLTTSIICTLPALTHTVQLPSSISWLFDGSLFDLDWNLISNGQIWRLFTSFLVVGAFVPGLTLFTVMCMILIGTYVRELEEYYYADGSRGAARLTAVLLFGACALIGIANKVTKTPFLGMPLIFFAISHLALLDPWQRLGESNVLVRWHLPYLLLVPLAMVALPMVGQAFVGILLGYVYYIITVRVKERFNISLWMHEPSLLVRIYQHFGIGQPKIGLAAQQGHSIATDESHES